MRKRGAGISRANRQNKMCEKSGKLLVCVYMLMYKRGAEIHSINLWILLIAKML